MKSNQGKKTTRTTKQKIALKTLKNPQHKTTQKLEQTFITLSGETRTTCLFFMCWCVLQSYVETCLKKYHQPVCTNRVWVFASLHSRNSWCREDWRYLLFKNVLFGALVCGLFGFCFLFEAGMSYMGWCSCILFFFTPLHISGIFFCISYSERKNLSIISRKLWHVQNLNFHFRLSRQTVSLWDMYSDFCNSSNYE